jgi:hypothetical protein
MPTDSATRPWARSLQRPADDERDAGHHQLRHHDAGAERQGVGARVGTRENLPGHRQHRRIAEVEQDDGTEEYAQVAITEKVAQRDRPPVLRLSAVAAARQVVVDVTGADAVDGRHHAGGKDAHQAENRAVAPEPAADADQNRRRKSAGVAEGLVAAELRREAPVPDFRAKRPVSRTATRVPAPTY